MQFADLKQKNFILMSLDNDTIAKGTGLTIEQIEKLHNEK